MRRPFCLTGLAFAVALLLGMYLMPKGAETYGGLDREQVRLLGVVEWKEHKISKGEEVLVVSLGQVIVLNPVLADSLEYLPEKIREATVKQIKKYCENNRARLCLPGAEGIEGVLCYPQEEPAMGSVVLMEGKFYAFSHATNPGEFDGAEYYRILGQQGRLMQADCLSRSRNYSRFRETLYTCRKYLSLILHASYPEKEASVMGAMLLGEKGMLDGEIKSLYQHNGIIHILAISGLHLSILGMGFYKLLIRLHVPKVVDIILSIALMYCYGIMTGMGVSIVRALVMFGLNLCASLVGRTYDLPSAVTAAALLILVRQPLYLTHSGFLFSFGAVCALGFLPEVSGCFPGRNPFLKTLSAGAWVSFVTLPVHLCFYYEFPLYSIFLNLIVIPCMGLLLISGVCVMGASAVFLPLGRFAAFPGIWILTFYEKCCEFCMELPGQRLVTGRPENWQVVFFLGLLSVAVFFAGKKKKGHFWCALLAAAMLLTCRMPQGFEITVLDIGQGDCIYLADGQGGHYLIDGGSSDKKEVETYQIIPFLKYRGVSRLNAVLISHSDEDHISGILGLLKDYGEAGIEIGCLFLPDIAEESRDENYLELASLARSLDIPVAFLHEGERLGNGKLMLTCLHPNKSYVNLDANDGSMVLYLTYENFSALFTGDLEDEGESLVTRRLARMRETGVLPEEITLLKAAHHGSKNSTKEEFLELVNPRLTLISAGRNNSYGHPHKETLARLEKRGCRILQTPESGAVTVRLRGEKVSVERYIE